MPQYLSLTVSFAHTSTPTVLSHCLFCLLVLEHPQVSPVGRFLFFHQRTSVHLRDFSTAPQSFYSRIQSVAWRVLTLYRIPTSSALIHLATLIVFS